jgi:hypothetical protein
MKRDWIFKKREGKDLIHLRHTAALLQAAGQRSAHGANGNRAPQLPWPLAHRLSEHPGRLWNAVVVRTRDDGRNLRVAQATSVAKLSCGRRYAPAVRVEPRQSLRHRPPPRGIVDAHLDLNTPRALRRGLQLPETTG